MKIVREYEDYCQYLDHQKEKTIKRMGQSKPEGFQIRVDTFKSLFADHAKLIKRCSSGLCVCARQGHEVVALKQLGMGHAVGIDLVPFPPHVVIGDMHNIPYEECVFDFVFSNAFDHSINPVLFIYEVERVLKPKGHCLLHLLVNPKSVDGYAENIISKVDDVISQFSKSVVVLSGALKKVKGNSLNAQLLMRKQ
jgi:SAM-dependent methyltransferase